MTQKYFTVLTNVGAAALSNAIALGRDLKIATFSVGDGGSADYDPTVEQLKAAVDLVNKNYTGGVNELKQDENNPARFYIEGIVPVDVGGFTVREAAWYLDNGTLFAITKFPPSYKTIPADGAATELPVRTYIATGAVDNIVLKIDPTVVMATRSYVDVRTQQIITELNDKFKWDRSPLIIVSKRHTLSAEYEYLSPLTRADNTELQDGDSFYVRASSGEPVIKQANDDETTAKFKRLADGAIDTEVTIVADDKNERVFVYNKELNVWEF